MVDPVELTWQHLFSATDIANFLSCHHLSTLERAKERGEIQKPFSRDPGVELFRELGIRHEAQYIRHLIDTLGFQIVRIPADIPWGDAVDGGAPGSGLYKSSTG